MADSRISELTAYTSTINTDLLPIVDITTSITKKITLDNIRRAIIGFITVGRSNANYVCDGTADNVQIQEALDSLT